LVVVTKGPVASAGSIFMEFKAKGTNVPNNDANTITDNNAVLTEKVIA
jgi:hypothetical protein